VIARTVYYLHGVMASGDVGKMSWKCCAITLDEVERIVI
jgi:hypothetical protein